MTVSGRTKVFALIGCPVDHSLSPLIQNAAFAYLDLDYVYVAFNVPKDRLRDAIFGIKCLNFYGFNVTMPHKISIVKYLDEIDEDAKRIGAVNTVVQVNGVMKGYNTDGTGILNALEYNQVESQGKKVVLIGAGGASRAILYALAKQTRNIVILNRTASKAEILVNQFVRQSKDSTDIRFGALNEEQLANELEDASILINATSIGMDPTKNETPVPSNMLRSNLVVLDLVYEPLETRLLMEAKRIGAKTINGLNMLVHQGAASFKLWTGEKAPVAVMMKKALEESASVG